MKSKFKSEKSNQKQTKAKRQKKDNKIDMPVRWPLYVCLLSIGTTEHYTKFTPTYLLVYILLVNKVIYKWPHSYTKNWIHKWHRLSPKTRIKRNIMRLFKKKKQAIFFFTVFFFPLIPNNYFITYCLLTLLLFFVFPSISF